MLFNIVSYILSLTRGPYWGLFAYMNIYFNTPNARLNWWAELLPFDRWSLLSSVVLIVSVFIHRKKLSNFKFENTRWIFIFLALSTIIVTTISIEQSSANRHLYLLFTYSLVAYFILRAITNADQLRWFFLAIVAFGANLSLNAYLYGRRINNRLEFIGSADANGSNEFALLLAAIIPLVFVFIKNGNRYERIIAIFSMPFILNAFILCNSRGSAVAFIGGIAISFLMIADRQMRIGVIALGIIIAPIFLYLTDAEYIERFQTMLGFSEALEDTNSARKLSSGRTEIWEYGVNMAKDHPLGVGPQGFKELSRFYMPKEVLTFKKNNPQGARSAHNTYLQVMVEQGILGLIIWLCMCFHTCLLMRRAFVITSKLKTPQPLWKDAAFGLSVAFFTIMLGGLFNSRVYYEFFWWQVAIAAVVYALAKEMAVKEEQDEQEEIKVTA